MIKRSDFSASKDDPHRWYYNYEIGEKGKPGYLALQFVAYKNDGVLEISIRGPLTSDLTLIDWDIALRTFNEHLKNEIIAIEKETG
jgi:hypothetical protein